VTALAAPHVVAVLVADDDPQSRALSRASLPAAWRVIEARTGRDVLSVVASEDVDLVVLGLPLPDADALDICRAMRRRAEGGPLLPIILLAGEPRPGESEAFAAGAHDLLSKPVDSRELALRARVLVHLREEARELFALEDELSSLLAHDLKNPLAAAVGILGMLRTEVADPALREDLATASGGIARTRELLEDVLRARMLERGTLVPARHRSDLADIAAEAAQELAESAREQGVAIAGPQAPGPAIAVDPELARRAVGNLVANAIRYSRSGSTIEISARAEAAGAVLEVADRGPAIPDELKIDVFGRLGSVLAARAHARRGQGLALYLVRLVAEAHGGRVEALDREGGGSVFRLVLAGTPGSARSP